MAGEKGAMQGVGSGHPSLSQASAQAFAQAYSCSLDQILPPHKDNNYYLVLFTIVPDIT